MAKENKKEIQDVLQRINEQMYERNVELSVKNKTLSVLGDVYQIINTTLGVRNTAERISYTIAHKLGLRGAAILLPDNRKRIVHVEALTSHRKKPSIKNARALSKLRKVTYSMKNTKNPVIEVIKSGEKRTIHSFNALLGDNIDSKVASKMQAQLNVVSVVIYPIHFAGRTIGALIIALDKHEKDMSRAERDTMHAVLEVVGIALEQARIYTDLKKANKKLKELDRLKDDFVSVASHELRTPMTVIKSYLWMALAGKGGKLSTKQKYYIQRAYTSSDRLIKLVNDMLNISRIESGRITIEFDKIDVRKLIKDVIDEVHPRADELGLKLLFDGTLFEESKVSPNVIADSDKIKEVLFNLVGNSLKFTDKGGTITISCENDNDRIRVKVIDTGRGIDIKDFPTLFTKFGMVPGSYETNKKASGTGLGLYISREIIKIHHGTMAVESDGIGKGSTFSFTVAKYSESRLNRYRKGDHKGKVEIIHTGL